MSVDWANMVTLLEYMVKILFLIKQYVTHALTPDIKRINILFLTDSFSGQNYSNNIILNGPKVIK